jgi:hypothetical protein
VNHLSNIFGRETGGFIALHRVNAKQARAKDPTDPEQGVKALNSNSPIVNSGGPKAFAVVYINDTLPGRQVGRSGLDNDPNSTENSGVSPITIDLKKINTDAALLRASNPAPYATTLLEQTLAHETGHKLGRDHRMRSAAKVAFDENAISTSLQYGEFMQQPDKLTRLFVEEFVYRLTQAAGFAVDKVYADERVKLGAVLGSGGGLVSVSLKVPGQEPYQGPAQPPFWPFKVKTKQEQVLDQVTLESQDGTIMCWTPELDKQQPTDWHFALDDLDALCLRANGCKAGN